MNTSPIKQAFILFFFFAFCGQFFAQDKKPKDELFLLHEDIIKVDKIKQYEDNVKKEMELWKKYGMETTISLASKNDDNRYFFLTPLKSYGDIDKQNEYWDNFTKKAGKDIVNNLYKNYEGTYVSHNNTIIKRKVDLSYYPDKDNSKNNENKFLHFDHYFFKEGKMSEGLKLMKEFKELMVKKKSKDSYTVWTSDIGGDIGRVIVVRAAKNNVEYYEKTNKRMKSISEELKDLWPRFSVLLKEFSHNNGTPRPDHTYSPGK